MKEGIHPAYYQATVTCNCGNTFVTGSTKKEIHVEVCSKCHSFYTGQQKTARTDGRIDKFNRKYGIVNKQDVWRVEVVISQPFSFLRFRIDFTQKGKDRYLVQEEDTGI